MTKLDQQCDVLSCCESMCSKCLYGDSNPKLLDNSMCHMCDNYVCKGRFVETFFAKCVQCDSNCCANPSRDCCFSCENCDEQYCTTCWLSNVARTCPGCDHFTKCKNCLLQLDECPNCSYVPSGCEDDEEHIVLECFESLNDDDKACL
jgi:hypothetical protein